MAGIYSPTDVATLIAAIDAAKAYCVSNNFNNAMLEIEDRFDTVDVGTFERVKSKFHILKKGYDMQYQQTDYINGEYRRSVTVTRDGKTTETYSRKIKGLTVGTYWIVYNTTFPFRTGISIEIPLTFEAYTAGLATTTGPQVIRHKNRVGFTVPKPVCIIDCTAVTADDYTTYEIERDTTISINDLFTSAALTAGIDIIKKILAVIEDTEVLYTLGQGNDIVSIYNNYVDVEESSK